MYSNLTKVILFGILFLCIITGCSNGHGGSPISPQGGADSLQTTTHVHRDYDGHRSLIGLWDVAYDFSTKEFVPILMRAAEMHANVVGMLNGNPANLKVVVTDDSQGMTEGIFGLNVTIIHPLQNSVYRGFDVKGIVMGKGASTLSAKDDPDLMWLNPNSGLRLLNYDGWTRWWNPSEFGDPGLFGYTPGLFGTPGFTTSATLNPYKYFSSALDFDDPVDEAANLNSRGNFSTSKATGETREYFIKFPMVGGMPSLNYQYAVDASWAQPTGGGSVPDFTDFPPEANCPEPFYIKVDQSESDVYYITGDNRGGNLALDIEVFDWGAKTGGIADQINSITVQSGTLFSSVQSVPVTSPDPGTDWSGIYHFNLQDVTPSSDKNQEVLITIESTEGSYSPPGGVQEHPVEPLAAYVLVNIETRGPATEGQGKLSGLLNPVDVKTPETSSGQEGDTSYVVDDNGLQVFNVVNTESPVQVVEDLDLEGAPVALDVDRDSGYAYAVTGNATKEFRVVDVGDLSNPVLVPTGINTDAAATALDVSVDPGGDKAYVGDSGGKVKIVNLSVPATPQEVGSFTVAGGAAINDVVQASGVAYVACNNFQIWNVSIPGSIPPVVKTLNLGSTVTATVYDSSGYVIAGDASGKIHVINVKIPASASVVGTYVTPAKINDLTIRENLLFASVDQHPVQILFFNEATQGLELLAENAGVADPNKMCLSGNISYVIDDAAHEVDISQYLPVNQPDYIGWGRTFGGTNYDYAECVARSDSGDVAICGDFLGTIDLDPGSGTSNWISKGGQDIFVSKFDSEGNFIWGIAFGGTGDEVAGCCTFDTSGNIIVGGRFSTTVNFDPLGSAGGSRLSLGYHDAYVASYDPDGDFNWVNIWGSISGGDVDSVNDVIVNGGVVYTLGSCMWTVDFDPGSGVDSYYSPRPATCLVEYGTSGSYIRYLAWRGEGGYDDLREFTGGLAASTDEDKIFIAGSFIGDDVDLDPTDGNNTSYMSTNGGQNENGYLTAVNTAGTTCYFIKTWGGTGYQNHNEVLDLAKDVDNNVYVSGYFRNVCQFNPSGGDSRTSLGGADGFLSKFSPNGTFSWVRQIGATGNNECRGVSSQGGSVYVVGYFTGDGDFDETNHDYYSSAGTQDGFVTSFTAAAGIYNWTRTYGWTNDDGVVEVHAATDGNVYAVGGFTGFIDINPDPGVYDFRAAANGSYDAFITKITSNGLWE